MTLTFEASEDVWVLTWLALIAGMGIFSQVCSVTHTFIFISSSYSSIMVALLWFWLLTAQSGNGQTKLVNVGSKSTTNYITVLLIGQTSPSSHSYLQRPTHSCHLITALRHPSVKPLKHRYLALTPAERGWKFSQLLTVTVVLLQQVPIGFDCSPSLISHQAGALGPTGDRICGPPWPSESPRPITMN